MNKLQTDLIEKALALTNKTMKDMNLNPILCKFHMPNFYAYLLSPEFIEKYKTKVPMAMEKPNWVCYIVAETIYESQS
jgi:hypothetical protein